MANEGISWMRHLWKCDSFSRVSHFKLDEEGPTVHSRLPIDALLSRSVHIECYQCRPTIHLPQIGKGRWKEIHGVRTEPSRYDDVLLTAGGIADNPTAHAGPCVEVPQNVA